MNRTRFIALGITSLLFNILLPSASLQEWILFIKQLFNNFDNQTELLYKHYPILSPWFGNFVLIGVIFYIIWLTNRVTK